MEKQEARIKCTGCGSSYKLKVPVTDKPVNFKCKKCGKILKVKVTKGTDQPLVAAPTPAPTPAPARTPAPAPAPAPPEPDSPIQGFETTQLDEFENFFESGVGAPPQKPEPSQEGFQLDPTLALFTTDRMGDEGPQIKPSLDATVRIPEPVFEQGYADQLFPQPQQAKQASAPAAPARTRGSERRWLALDDEQVKGPFTDAEVVSMIEDGEISAETPLRMGQRPWIKAAQVADFKHCFHKGRPIRSGSKRAVEHAQPTPNQETAQPESEVTPFYEEFGAIAPYPLDKRNLQPLGIFAGIAFVLCTLLSFDFFIGLPLCIAGWIVLYGYLDVLRNKTKADPTTLLPAWDFSHAKDMALSGAKVFAVLLLFSLIPVTVCLLLMIGCFLNDQALLGYVFMLATIVVFVVSLFVTPAALVIQEEGQSVVSALNPVKILRLISRGSTAYRMLAIASIGGGLACMVVVLLAVFLVDIPTAGFVVAGLVMALVLSYVNLIWFHVLGRFARENNKLVTQIV